MNLVTISQWEQWAVAAHFIRKHGQEAPLVIAMRADHLLEEGEVRGARTFAAIMCKSERLLQGTEGSIH